MKRLLLILVLALAPGGAIRSFASAMPSVTLVDSAAVGHGDVSREQLETAYRLLAHEMAIEPKSLPTIVVVHVTAREADAAGMRDIAALRINKDKGQYYEVWLVGKKSLEQCVMVLNYLLEQHFQLAHDRAEQKAIVARVVRYLDATVSVNSWR